MTALPPIAVSMGDPAGIGPEITVKAWQALRGNPSAVFYVIGCPALYPKCQTISALAQAAKTFQTALPVLPIDVPAVVCGSPNANAANAITGAIEMATACALSGEAAAVVTNPIAKDILYAAGFKFPGHTEYLAELTKAVTPPYARGPVMMLTAQDLRVALVTIHTSLASVPPLITAERIMEVARILHGALRTDFGIKMPRIALAGLNPHAGENGALGREEIEIINPAAAKLRASGINITDAQSADTLFHAQARENYDAALCMYHDQGLIPVKTLDFHGGVNTTLGLPIIRTSPDHGTAFDIAGQGIARPDSLIAAIHAARHMAACRAQK